MWLKQHKWERNEGIQHNCDKCDFQGTRKTQVRIHELSAHDCVKYSCDQWIIKLYKKQLCLGTNVSNMVEYPNSSVTNVHFNLFTGVEWVYICKNMDGWRFKCEYCDYKVGDQGSFRKHIILVYQETYPQTQRQPGVPGWPPASPWSPPWSSWSRYWAGQDTPKSVEINTFKNGQFLIMITTSMFEAKVRFISVPAEIISTLLYSSGEYEQAVQPLFTPVTIFFTWRKIIVHFIDMPTSSYICTRDENKTPLNFMVFVTAQLNLNWSWSLTLGRKPPPHPTTTQELLRHFQIT